MEQYDVGEMVIYPSQGVAQIQRLEDVEVHGVSTRCYHLSCLDSESLILIPISRMKSVRIRRLVSEAEIDEILESLRDLNTIFHEPNWNRRQRAYTERLQTGLLEDVALLLRDLAHRKISRPLADGERRTYDVARHLAAQEISVVRKQPYEEVCDLLETYLSPPVQS